MPNCSVCGARVGLFENRGLLRWEHGHCRSERQRERAARREREAAARHEQEAQARLAGTAVTAALGDSPLDELVEALSGQQLGRTAERRLLIDGFEAAVDRAMEDGLLSQAEEEALSSYQHRLELSQSELNANGAYTRVAQGGMLRDVMEGKIPQRLNAGSDRPPFNLMKSEQLVWFQPGAEYYQLKTRREFRGRSHGASIRIASGVYYRPSVFKGQSVAREETVHTDTGIIGFTTKHIYFHGDRERFRVRYDRIVSFEPFEDGVGIMRDRQTAKPETFKTGDGWFIYNLVTNLSQL